MVPLWITNNYSFANVSQQIQGYVQLKLLLYIVSVHFTTGQQSSTGASNTARIDASQNSDGGEMNSWCNVA